MGCKSRRYYTTHPADFRHAVISMTGHLCVETLQSYAFPSTLPIYNTVAHGFVHVRIPTHTAWPHGSGMIVNLT